MPTSGTMPTPGTRCTVTTRGTPSTTPTPDTTCMPDTATTPDTAATAITFRTVSFEIPTEPIVVTVDRPFLLAVRHARSGALYFLAQIARP